MASNYKLNTVAMRHSETATALKCYELGKMCFVHGVASVPLLLKNVVSREELLKECSKLCGGIPAEDVEEMLRDEVIAGGVKHCLDQGWYAHHDSLEILSAATLQFAQGKSLEVFCSRLRDEHDVFDAASVQEISIVKNSGTKSVPEAERPVVAVAGGEQKNISDVEEDTYLSQYLPQSILRLSASESKHVVAIVNNWKEGLRSARQCVVADQSLENVMLKSPKTNEPVIYLEPTIMDNKANADDDEAVEPDHDVPQVPLAIATVASRKQYPDTFLEMTSSQTVGDFQQPKRQAEGDADNIAAEEDDNSVKKVSIAAQSTTSIETVSENSSSKKRALRDRPDAVPKELIPNDLVGKKVKCDEPSHAGEQTTVVPACVGKIPRIQNKALDPFMSTNPGPYASESVIKRAEYILQAALSPINYDTDVFQGKTKLYGKDISSLWCPGKWLTGDILNASMHSLVGRRNSCAPNSCYAFSSYASKKLETFKEGQQPFLFQGRRNQTNVFGLHKVVFFPYHQNDNHWLLIVGYMEEQKIVLYDSIRKSQFYDILACFLNFMRAEWRRWRVNKPFDALEWVMIVDTTDRVPQQQGIVDCGVYVLAYAESIANQMVDHKSVKFLFTQDHIPELRVRFTKDLLYSLASE